MVEALKKGTTYFPVARIWGRGRCSRHALQLKVGRRVRIKRFETHGHCATICYSGPHVDPTPPLPPWGPMLHGRQPPPATPRARRHQYASRSKQGGGLGPREHPERAHRAPAGYCACAIDTCAPAPRALPPLSSLVAFHVQGAYRAMETRLVSDEHPKAAAVPPYVRRVLTRSCDDAHRSSCGGHYGILRIVVACHLCAGWWWVTETLLYPRFRRS